MPRDLIDDLSRTGLFSLSVPRAIGGQEATPFEILQAIETVATADGSTGWCAMIGVGNNVTAGYLNESGAKAVYADPIAPSAGIAAPAGAAVRANGAVRISGRWAVCERHYAQSLALGGSMRPSTGPNPFTRCRPSAGSSRSSFA